MLFGCHKPYYGGNTDILITDKSSHVEDEGAASTTDNTIAITMASPSAPEAPSKIVVTKTPDGKLSIETFNSPSYNIAGTLAKVALLEIPMYAGIGLIVLGVGVFFLLRDIKWTLIIAGTGVAMIIGSYLLAEYSMYFLLGGLVIFAYLGYLFIDYIRQRKANDETIKAVQVLKETGVVEREKVNKVFGVMQSGSTKKIVEKIKHG
jgi:hypothetical protein